MATVHAAVLEGSQPWGGSWDGRYWSTGLSADVVASSAAKAASITNAVTASDAVVAIASKICAAVDAALAADFSSASNLFVSVSSGVASAVDMTSGMAQFYTAAYDAAAASAGGSAAVSAAAYVVEQAAVGDVVGGVASVMVDVMENLVASEQQIADRICDVVVLASTNASDGTEASVLVVIAIIERALPVDDAFGSNLKSVTLSEYASADDAESGAAIKYDAVFSFAVPSDHTAARHYSPVVQGSARAPLRDLLANPDRKGLLITPGVVVDFGDGSKIPSNLS